MDVGFRQTPRDPLDGDLGGVLENGWFNLNIPSENFTDAKTAEREFRAAGYTVELLDEIDLYSSRAFLTVSKLAGERICASVSCSSLVSGLTQLPLA